VDAMGGLKDSDKIKKPLLGILSDQVAAAVAEAAADVGGLVSEFLSLDQQLAGLTKSGLIDLDSTKKIEVTLGGIVIHMQCFDLLAQKLSHVQNALKLLDAEIPAELSHELSRKLDNKVKGLYSSSEELNIHMGESDNTSCENSELF
jgi:hypothetical protein